jgi:hypothetical protein
MPVVNAATLTGRAATGQAATRRGASVTPPAR